MGHTLSSRYSYRRKNYLKFNFSCCCFFKSCELVKILLPLDPSIAGSIEFSGVPDPSGLVAEPHLLRGDGVVGVDHVGAGHQLIALWKGRISIYESLMIIFLHCSTLVIRHFYWNSLYFLVTVALYILYILYSLFKTIHRE